MTLNMAMLLQLGMLHTLTLLGYCQWQLPYVAGCHLLMKCCVLCRLVRTDVSARSTDVAWEEVIPEHPSNLLQWAVALKVRAFFSCRIQITLALWLSAAAKPCALSGRHTWNSISIPV